VSGHDDLHQPAVRPMPQERNADDFGSMCCRTSERPVMPLRFRLVLALGGRFSSRWEPAIV
jgi:hypothetical protein